MRKLFEEFGRKHRILWAVVLAACLLLGGCGNTAQEPEVTRPADSGMTAEPTDSTESVPATEDTQPTEEVQGMDDAAYASLVSFRQALVGTPQQFAAAYFGYALPDADAPVDPIGVMGGIAPLLCDNLPFLRQIPAGNSAGTEGHLFCVLPTDEEASVMVVYRPWDEATETYGDGELLYHSLTGEPFLLMTTNTGWCLETEVIITDSRGEVTFWYPFIDENNRIAALCDEDGNSLYLDFSPYERLNEENLIGGPPIEMVGTWELTWTEVEGDRVEQAPGGCTVEITTDGMGFFWLSYADRYYPEDNFYDRELLVSPGEMYPGCGNNQWVAEVYDPAGEGVRFAVTLLEDDSLLMQYCWEMDGVPMVSHGWYRRIG